MQWHRVTTKNPCPICEGIKWCLVNDNSSAVICPRTISDRQIGEAGYLHIIDVKKNVAFEPTEFEKKFLSYQENMFPEMLEFLAQELNVSIDSIQHLGVGFFPGEQAWIFCERDDKGRIIGLMKRYRDGKKLVISDSKRGLYYEYPLPNSIKPILVVEGASDTLAAIQMGYSVVGKPNAESGHSFLSSLLKGKNVIVVGENDEAGRRGMIKTFNALRPVCKVVKKVLPPSEFKDLRQWMPTAEIFDQWVNNQAEQADNSQMVETIDFNMLAERWLANYKEPLLYYFEDWYRYDGVCYRLMQRGWLQSQIREFFRNYEVVEYRGKNSSVRPLQINTYFVTEIEAALKCLCRTDMKTRTDRPFWIGA